MIPLYMYLALVAGTVVVALLDWRKAVYLLILIGVLQDPVRKMTPGVPAYLVLAPIPVWGAIIGVVLGEWPRAWPLFRRCHPWLAGAMGVSLVSLFIPAFLSATYGRGSWQLSVIGAISYLSPLAGFAVGFLFPRRKGQVERLLALYCVLTAIMMIGGPLEHIGMGASYRLVGAEVLGHEWIRHIPGYQLKMIAGFYRSPDVMGWHAALLVMLGVCLSLRSRGAARLAWAAAAGWGIVGLMLCGRRKMLFMLPAFMIALPLLHLWGKRRGEAVLRVLSVGAVTLGLGVVLYGNVFPSSDAEQYYFRYQGNTLRERLKTHAVDALYQTYRQHGFLGAGLGTATQGTQHVDCERPETWQEGGLSRVLVELGVPGLIAFLYLGLVLILSSIRVVGTLDAHRADRGLYAGLTALVLANGGSFVVSHQVFGDPFVVCFTALLVGLLLSAMRTVAPRDAGSAPPPPDPPAETA